MNDGVEITSSVPTIDGPAQLNGGTLLIGYLDESLGAATTGFVPIQFRGGVKGEFAESIDTGGVVLLVECARNAPTVIGSAVEIPDSIVDDLVRFRNDSDSLNALVNSNKSEAEAMIEDLRDQSEEDGSLVCN
jgi:hypothetical protein